MINLILAILLTEKVIKNYNMILQVLIMKLMLLKNVYKMSYNNYNNKNILVPNFLNDFIINIFNIINT